jgi:hypothetical protein
MKTVCFTWSHNRSLFLLGILASLSLPTIPAFAREKWPAGTDQSKKNAIEWKKLDAELLERLQPEIAAWAAKGKPFIPNAGQPGVDLPQASVPAFPGAEGSGAHTFGGRGGKAYVVTSLADSGPGTLREALEAAGPRIVVFNVSGIIQLTRPINVYAPYVTIAGQTAPGDGICVAGETTEIDTHDVIIRYMRFRRGEADVGNRDDALGGNPIGNIIIDHCSTSWGFDENLSMYRHIYTPPVAKGEKSSKDLKLPTVNITIQWSISSEALDTFNHAFGGTWGGRYASFHHNLFASNTGRNPSIGWGDHIDFRNNVIFNWRHRTLDGGDATSHVNVVANYFKPGPATPDGNIHFRIAKPEAFRNFHEGPGEGQWYVANNIVAGNEKVTADNWDGGVQFTDTKSEKPADKVEALLEKGRKASPADAPALTVTTADKAYGLVLADTGATLPHRDPVDLRVIEEVRTGKVSYPENKGIITDIKQVGGYPDYKGAPRPDIGADGIPVSWKKKYHLDINDTDLASKDLKGDGYTVIDKYLAGLNPTKKIDWKEAQNNVNTLNETTFKSSAL